METSLLTFTVQKTYFVFHNTLQKPGINGKSREVTLLFATVKKSCCTFVRQKIELLMNEI